MAVIISDSGNTSYDGNLSTTNGFYRVEAHNLGCLSTTPLALNTTRNITVTFANAGNCEGILLAIAPYATYGTSGPTMSVMVDLQEYDGISTWTSRATKTLTRNQITTSTLVHSGTSYFVPFEFATPYAITTDGGKWRFQVTESGGSGIWQISTSDATNAFYAAWCDTKVSFSSGNDAVIAKDKITINQTATFRGVAVTGVATYSVCGIACRASDPTPDNVCMFEWMNPPAAAYTLTLDGYLFFAGQSGFRVGTDTKRIALAVQATIVQQKAATIGTAGNSGLYGINQATGGSIFMYGAIPTYQRTTLKSDAETGQKNLVCNDNVNWVNGDSIVVGKQNVIGTGDTTIYTVDSVAGDTITTTTNIATYKRYAGGYVVRLNGYGVVWKADTAVTVSTMGVLNNWVLSGVQAFNIRIAELGTYSTYDDTANTTKWSFSDCYLSDSSGAYFFTYVSPPPKGMDITNCSTHYSTWWNSIANGNDGKAGPMTITNHVIISGGLYNNNMSANYSNLTLTGCTVQNFGYPFLYVNGATHTFTNNKFWGVANPSAVFRIDSTVNSVFSGNYYDKCTCAINFYLTSYNVNFTDEYFGTEVANTKNIDFLSSPFYISTFTRPRITAAPDATNILNSVPGSRLHFESYNNTTGDDRTYSRYGKTQRTGTGLTDTTCRTTGGSALRYLPESSTVNLDWSFSIATGNIQNQVTVIGVWVYINDAAFWAGTNQMPRITVNYDNGTTTYGEASQTAGSWQYIHAVFTPTTTYGSVTVTLSARTDATSTNAYVYWDDFSGGFLVNTTMDSWSNALPVPPAYSFNVNAATFWEYSTASATAAGSMGKHIKKKLASIFNFTA